MKNLTTVFFLSLFFSITCYGTDWTVSNNPNLPAQFTTIQEAVDAATSGDRVFVHSSPNFYVGFKVSDKKLDIIGEGYSGSKSTIINLGGHVIYFSAGSDGSTIVGFRIQQTRFNPNSAVYFSSNITMEKCHISDRIGIRVTEENIIKNCIVDTNLSIQGNNNFLVNNIFLERSVFGNAKLVAIRGYSNINGIIIKNNIFSGSISGSRIALFGNVFGAIVSDNIFYHALQTTADCASCEFSNNLFFENTETLSEENNNINNQDPNFLFVPEDLSDVFSYDFHLQDNSPAKDVATDGGDLGIYGGSYPMPERLDGAPALPRVTSFALKNIVVGQDGKLEFVIKAVAR